LFVQIYIFFTAGLQYFIEEHVSFEVDGTDKKRIKTKNCIFRYCTKRAFQGWLVTDIWCRKRGVKPHPQKFWFGENPGKIFENLLKLPESLSKNGAQHVLIWK